jgi:predicted RNA binding protein YcfA (HicA-like mRNA interferase family)
MNRDIKKLVQRAERQGFRLQAGKGHYMLFAPDGVSIVTVAKTPSDHCTIPNTIADLRRCGFDPRRK